MAKINAYGARKVGPTLFTERTRPPISDEDGARVYYEAWRVRSDGTVQTRIISTRPLDDKGHVTKHSSGFTNFGRFSAENLDHPKSLRIWLKRKGFLIVKEVW